MCRTETSVAEYAHVAMRRGSLNGMVRGGTRRVVVVCCADGKGEERSQVISSE